MKITNIFIDVFILTILFFGTAASYAAQTGGGGGRSKISDTKPPEFETDKTGVKTIGEGSDSSVATPFVFVARTTETLRMLKTLVKNLPTEPIDFNRTAIVAAFAGTKNTGGYSLEITGTADNLSIKTAAPPKDAMVTESLTTPYKIVAVAVERGNGLNLDLSSDFTRAAKNYRLTDGKFESSGGFAGVRKSFAARGAIRVLSSGKFATLIFNLTGTADDAKRKLFEAASGALARNGKISVARLEAGDFIDRPHPFMTAAGTLAGKKLVLIFAPGKPEGYTVSDGFAGGGKLEAVSVQ